MKVRIAIIVLLASLLAGCDKDEKKQRPIPTTEWNCGSQIAPHQDCE
jgi:nitrous oxide reductase accessory protein NosL